MNWRSGLLIILVLCQSGCVTLFGWDIHAPAVLSQLFYDKVIPGKERVALYLPPDLIAYQSKNRGGRFADPQTYHVGEAFVPMVIEGLQYAFQEFILMETEPTPDILKRYGISYLMVMRIKDFGNRVTFKGQAVELETVVLIYDSELHFVKGIKARGSSDAQKVFAKKGGPEVNLNAAIENNVIATIQLLQDYIHENKE